MKNLAPWVFLLIVSQAMSADIEWPAYGGDLASTKYSAAAQIDAGNVASLAIAWRGESPDNAIAAGQTRERPGSFKSTPLMIAGVLYTSTGFSQVAAIDAASGATLWTFDPKAYTSGRRPANSGWQHRGLMYW